MGLPLPDTSKFTLGASTCRTAASERYSEPKFTRSPLSAPGTLTYLPRSAVMLPSQIRSSVKPCCSEGISTYFRASGVTPPILQMLYGTHPGALVTHTGPFGPDLTLSAFVRFVLEKLPLVKFWYCVRPSWKYVSYENASVSCPLTPRTTRKAVCSRSLMRSPPSTSRRPRRNCANCWPGAGHSAANWLPLRSGLLQLVCIAPFGIELASTAVPCPKK